MSQPTLQSTETIEFDEAYYLKLYPDVKEWVDAGNGTAFEHFTKFGMPENRKPNPYFDPTFYLGENPTVKAEVTAGKYTAWDHYVNVGYHQGLAPSATLPPVTPPPANPTTAPTTPNNSVMMNEAQAALTYHTTQLNSLVQLVKELLSGAQTMPPTTPTAPAMPTTGMPNTMQQPMPMPMGNGTPMFVPVIIPFSSLFGQQPQQQFGQPSSPWGMPQQQFSQPSSPWGMPQQQWTPQPITQNFYMSQPQPKQQFSQQPMTQNFFMGQQPQQQQFAPQPMQQNFAMAQCQPSTVVRTFC
jgi:hypothetical protein